MNRTLYDALGRTTKTIENYVDGTVGADNDKTTEYTYNAAGMTSLTAKTIGGGGQTTLAEGMGRLGISGPCVDAVDGQALSGGAGDRNTAA